MKRLTLAGKGKPVNTRTPSLPSQSFSSSSFVPAVFRVVLYERNSVACFLHSSFFHPANCLDPFDALSLAHGKPSDSNGITRDTGRVRKRVECPEQATARRMGPQRGRRTTTRTIKAGRQTDNQEPPPPDKVPEAARGNIARPKQQMNTEYRQYRSISRPLQG